MKTATRIGVILFALVAVAHALRVITGTELIIGGPDNYWNAPMWISVLGTIVPGALAYLIAREHA